MISARGCGHSSVLSEAYRGWWEGEASNFLGKVPQMVRSLWWSWLSCRDRTAWIGVSCLACEKKKFGLSRVAWPWREGRFLCFSLAWKCVLVFFRLSAYGSICQKQPVHCLIQAVHRTCACLVRAVQWTCALLNLNSAPDGEQLDLSRLPYLCIVWSSSSLLSSSHPKLLLLQG